MDYIYLHGFASSPESTKARNFRDRFAQFKINLKIPDLNQGNFTNLTLSRQIEQVTAMLPPTPVTLIGSSFGGLTALFLAETHPQVERLILMAPALGFLSHWLPRLSQPQLWEWQHSGYLQVHHYGEKAILPLSYNFVTDMCSYDESSLQRRVPTLIFHGVHDDVIPIEASRNYKENREWVELRELESDHGLTNVTSLIWEALADWSNIRLIS